MADIVVFRVKEDVCEKDFYRLGKDISDWWTYNRDKPLLVKGLLPAQVISVSPCWLCDFCGRNNELDVCVGCGAPRMRIEYA